MAKCNLSIELVEPREHYHGGQTVRGVVQVDADEDVRCRGLLVRSAWKTHGYGNVASGEGDSQTLFSGQWTGGETYRYDFEVKLPYWPPTYHGRYLNIDHGIEAIADIPWAFDPKTSVPLHLTPIGGPDDAPQAEAGNTTANNVGCAVIGGVVFLVFGVMVVINPFFWLVIGAFAVIVGAWWFVFRYLPKARLGEVRYEMTAPRVSPPQPIAATLTIEPRRPVKINGIRWKVTATEICVSGSGSNRTTRRHEAFVHEQEIVGPTTLPPGKETRFDLQQTLPDNPPYSIDLSDNDLKWRSELRVDIPRWPDWNAAQEVQVVPVAIDPAERPVAGTAAPAVPAASQAPVQSPPSSGLTFAETARFLAASADDPGQRQQVIDAVRGLSFQVQVVVERRSLADSSDPDAYPSGHLVWGHFPDPEVPLQLMIPHDLADEFEQRGRLNPWTGSATVCGWDDRSRRLRLRMDSV